MVSRNEALTLLTSILFDSLPTSELRYQDLRKLWGVREPVIRDVARRISLATPEAFDRSWPETYALVKRRVYLARKEPTEQRHPGYVGLEA